MMKSETMALLPLVFAMSVACAETLKVEFPGPGHP